MYCVQIVIKKIIYIIIELFNNFYFDKLKKKMNLKIIIITRLVFSVVYLYI